MTVFVEYDTGDANLPNPSGHVNDLYEDISDSTETDSLTDDEESTFESRHPRSSWIFSNIASINPIHSFENRRNNVPPPVSLQHPKDDVPSHKSPIPVSPLSNTRPISDIILKQSIDDKGRQLPAVPPKSDGPQNARFDSQNIYTDTVRVKRRYSSHPGVTNAAKRKPGWEPGIDLDTTDIILESSGSIVTVVDYNSDRCRLARTEFYSNPRDTSSMDSCFYDKTHDVDLSLTKYLESRPKWSKVRWINVNGLSKTAIYTIGQHYKLHKLAIEDMVDIPQRTKVDEYPLHTFCCLPLHRLIPYKHLTGPRVRYNQFFNFFTKRFGGNNDNFAPQSATARFSTLAAVDSAKLAKSNINYKIKPHFDTLQSRLASTRNMKSMYQWSNPTQLQRSDYLESRRPLASRQKMVGVEQVSLYLTHEGTVISFFEGSGDEIEKPILERLESESTILRESADPSILFQAIIDAIVDLLHPIIAAYRSRLAELELAAILNPSMAHTRDLHLINADLTVLRNSITPVTSLINSLRDRAGNSRKKSDSDKGTSSATGVSSSCTTKPSRASSTRSDYSKISQEACVYLADVADHTLSYTQDLDVMRNNTKSMIDLIFNTISIQSSDAVKLLSLVTVIFLPLSFLTGYFGMNFTGFDALSNGVGYYWGIAVPSSASMTILLMYPWVRDNVRKIHQLIKRSRDHNRRKKQTRRKQKRRQVTVIESV
ncbi:Zinc transport protein zntB [Sugiyamaella lignohabitans]|uniref:Zinc transport protein zntB n=1 Tax=Sugiyamaella lignohabitans TaxID=796027 RepID=A0A167CNZ2_9ASCO|nr:Zinc transport protein zntB [Sugiyamaella lignohabitans]ANB11940.1 Zinc transport protein zntB [Sugiyamaella lignohabitans]